MVEPPADRSSPPPSPLAAAAGGSTDDFAIDADLIKVLASDSRRDILRLLRQRRMTLTELASALNLKKATVLEHLKRLTESGLVRRLEDERLWVYYELTRSGTRVVNPGRTRFYLIMSFAAAAALVGGGVVAAIAFDAAQDGAATLPTAPLDVRVERSERDADGAIALDLYYAQTPQRARALLVNASALGERPVHGIPLDLQEAEGGVARYRSMSVVPAGTYYVYVVDEAGRDNVDALYSITVPAYRVDAPAVLWQGLDAGGLFRVHVEDAPAEGSLLLASGEGAELPVLALTGGVAHLPADTLDRLVPATYALQYLPPDSRFWIMLDAAVEVRAPVAAVEPRFALAGRSVEIAYGFSPMHARAPPVLLTHDGAPVDASPTGLAYRAILPPMSPGDHTLQLGRAAPETLVVLPDVGWTIAPRGNATFDVWVADEKGALTNVTLLVDDALAGDASGLAPVRVENATGAARALRLVAADNTTLDSRVVDFDRLLEVDPLVEVVTLHATRENKTLTASVLLRNAGPLDAPVTVTATVDDHAFASRGVVLASGEETTLELAADVRLPPGDHPVRVAVLSAPRTPVAFVGAENATAAPPRDAPRGTVAERFVADDAAVVTIVTSNATSAPLLGEIGKPATEFRHFAPSPSGEAGASARVPAPGVGAVLALVAGAAWAWRRGRA